MPVVQPRTNSTVENLNQLITFIARVAVVIIRQRFSALRLSYSSLAVKPSIMNDPLRRLCLCCIYRFLTCVSADRLFNFWPPYLIHEMAAQWSESHGLSRGNAAWDHGEWLA